MNLPEPVDTEYPWERDHGIFELKENSLCFTCFYLDPYCENKSATIEKIYEELIQDELKPWLDHYIWSDTTLYTEIRHDHNEHYILGSLEFGENLIDEWLVTSLLFEFSSRYPDLYIHIFDNEGEFLLIELANCIPEFLDTNCGANRPWINNRQIVIIPNEYYPGRNLSLSESLKFLENCSFKLIKDDKLNKQLKSVLKEYPEKALENIFKVDVEVSEDVAQILYNNHRSLGAICIQESLGSPIESSAIHNAKIVKLSIQVPALCYANLINAGLIGDSLNIGWHVQNGLSKLKASGFNVNENFSSNEEAAVEFEKDHLQIELKRMSKIKDFIASRFDYDKPQTDTENKGEEELINRLKEVIQSSSTFEGIEKEKVNDSYNDESDYSSDTENEKIKRYFKDENVDIDEDDFFEFFCKEALHLKEEDLEKYRNLKFTKDEESASSDEDGELADDEEINDEDFDLDPETIQNLLQALKMEQGNGPANTLLNSLK